jgi:hypothetical protein
MNPENTIKALEMISQLPEKPKIFAIPSFRDTDPYAKIDPKVLEYAKACSYEPKLDKRGMMHYEDYKTLLDELELKQVGAICIYTVLSNDVEDE